MRNRCSPTTITNRRRSRATAPWPRRLRAAGRSLQTFKDQVIFERDEVLTLAGGPFSVFTPYKNAWLKRLAREPEALPPFETLPQPAALAPAPARTCAAVLTRPRLPAEPAPIVRRHARRRSAAGGILDRLGRYDRERDFPALRRDLAPVGAPALRHADDAPPGAPCCRARIGTAAAARRAGVAVGADLARVLHDDPRAPSARGHASFKLAFDAVALG